MALAVVAAGFLAGSAHTSQVALTFVGADNGIDMPVYLKTYAEERIPVGQWLGLHRRLDDLMTVGGAGVIPYYSEIPAYDVFGLVDATIAHDPRMTASNRPGHQKWGSDDYMLSRKPTLITHRYCLGGSCPVRQRLDASGLRMGPGDDLAARPEAVVLQFSQATRPRVRPVPGQAVELLSVGVEPVFAKEIAGAWHVLKQRIGRVMLRFVR